MTKTDTALVFWMLVAGICIMTSCAIAPREKAKPMGEVKMYLYNKADHSMCRKTKDGLQDCLVETDKQIVFPKATIMAIGQRIKNCEIAESKLGGKVLGN